MATETIRLDGSFKKYRLAWNRKAKEHVAFMISFGPLTHVIDPNSGVVLISAESEDEALAWVRHNLA